MDKPTDSLAERALSRLADGVYRYPRSFFYPLVVLMALSVFYTLNRLEFSTNRNDLVGTDKQYHSNYLAFKREFKSQDDIVAVVESEDPEKNRQFVERLGAKLESETDLFAEVVFKGDLRMLGRKALLFLPEETLLELRQTLQDYRPFIQHFARSTNLVSLFDLVNRQFRTAKREASPETESLLKALPALERLISQAAQSLQRPGTPPSPGINALFDSGQEAEHEMYITFDISPLLKDGDVKDPRQVILKLREGHDPAAQYLFGQMSPVARQRLAGYHSAMTPSKALRKILVLELNRLLQGPSLFHEPRFQKLALDDQVRRTADHHPQGEALARLNRKLLEAVFPATALVPATDSWFYLVSVRARAAGLNATAIARLRELVRQTQREVIGVNAGIIGEPVLEIDEMAQSQFDTTMATIVSLLIVAGIFIFGYNETGRPIKATLCLVAGLVLTMGYTTLTVGHLNILTITFAPMLIGLAIDFGVHLITRYEEELRRGGSERFALKKAMVQTGQGIFTGCFTTAGAFLAMGITDFKGVQEMGIITGGGLLVCLVPMMTLLPVLLLRGRQNVLDHAAPPVADQRARIENLWLERPVTVVVITTALCALSATQFKKVFFDYNLLNMQTEGLPAVEFEKKLIDSASKSVLYGAVIADSLPQAVAMEAKLNQLPAVASVDSMGRLLSEDQTRKLGVIGEIKAGIAGIRFAEVDRTPVKVSELNQTLFSLDGYLGQAMKEVQKEGDAALQAEMKSLQGSIRLLGQWINRGEAKAAAVKLAAFQQALFNDIRSTFDTLKSQDDRERLQAEDLPPALKSRFVGASGKLLLQVYPKENVWERAHQEEFVTQLRRVDPNVTGTPVQLLEYTTLLKESYQEAAWYALGAIVILVLVHFRSLTCVALALLPVGIGTIWMLGLMGWLAIPFNPANIMTLPLVIGIGVTNGIHILNRFAEERNPGILAKSTGKAVLVSGLTTIAGFGSLMLAKHQGIASLGYVMAIGVTTCMIAGLTFLPAMIKLLMRAGWRAK